MSDFPSALAGAEAALAQALSAACASRDEAEAAVEAAEFGPHGRSDVIQAETERHDRWVAVVEQLEALVSGLKDVREESEDL